LKLAQNQTFCAVSVISVDWKPLVAEARVGSPQSGCFILVYVSVVVSLRERATPC